MNLEVKKATALDIKDILSLFAHYDKGHITHDHFNDRDIALKAVDGNKLVAFVWGGLMAKNTIVYVDQLVIHPSYTGLKVIPLLYKQLFKEALSLGFKQAFGVIRHDEYHDKSCMNALKMGWYTEPKPFTYMYGSKEKMIKELGIEA